MKRNSIVNLIAEIKTRPAMFITRSDIFCLKAFLDGWTMSNSVSIKDGALMEGFQLWIENKYQSKTTHSWADLIAFYSGDQCNALKDFFILFDQYLAEI